MKKFIEYSSPWAFLLSISLMSCMLNLTSKFKMKEHSVMLVNLNYTLLFSVIMLVITMFLWLRDSSRESMIGYFNNDNNINVKLSVMIFLLSEILFFISFFWLFIYSSLSPDFNHWPYLNLHLPAPLGAPTLNTILLVASSATVTMSHYEMANTKSFSFFWLLLTLFLSFTFLMIQLLEYLSLPFNFTESIGGSIFFMGTGFHGLHVLIGTTALTTCMFMLLKKLFSSTSQLGFEMSIWYWHFVDAIWLMLFTLFYCWGH